MTYYTLRNEDGMPTKIIKFEEGTEEEIQRHVDIISQYYFENKDYCDDSYGGLNGLILDRLTRYRGGKIIEW